MLVLVLPRAAAAQAGRLTGRVADSLGNSIPSATVSVEGTNLRATTDDRGEYRIRAVPPGRYALRVRVIGFTPAATRIVVAPGQEVRQDFVLTRTPYQLAPIDVVVGSRARHTAADELAVPVDVYTSEEIRQQGTTETSQILQALAPSVNFPRQSVTDANDIVRPFTLRGLSPDHTLVLVNGWRRHQTAVVNTFAYGMGAGSSGVDLNALPASAVDRLEVLRDGAAAQYGSDAIAGVVNVVLREGRFAPFVTADVGRYMTADYPDDGTTVDVNGGVGLGIGRGSLGLFAEYRDRDPTNRAWADPFENGGVPGQEDVIDDKGRVVEKRNPVPQPNQHWGDGKSEDIMTFANFRLPLNDAATREVYAYGGYSFRQGTGQGYRRYADSGRNWPQIFPLGFLPEFNPDVTDYSAAGGYRGAAGAWSYDFGAAFGHNDFEYNLRNTLNVSLGPCLDTPCAPGPDGVLGTADDPGIPNKTSFFAGQVEREELLLGANVARPFEVGLAGPLNLAVGAAFRRERYQITRGETASWINGHHLDQFGDSAAVGSQVFAGFSPSDETDESRSNFGVYVDAEASVTARLLANAAARFETYSDFGERLTGKLALRYQPSQRVTIRVAGSTGFRAPGLSQSHYSKVTTNVIGGEFKDIGIFPVGHPAARLLGSRPLEEEKSFNFSGGFAFSPRDNVTVTADYFYIKIDDRILLGATFDDDVTVNILSAGGFTTIAGVQYFTNGLDTETQGVDVTANLRLPVGGSSTLDLLGAVNYTSNEITRVDPLPPQLAGSSEPGIIDSVTYIGITEERPDWRATLSARFATGRFHALARGSYFGEFSSAQPGFCDLCRERYGAKTIFDAEVGYRLNYVALAVGVRNLFDTYPDQPSSLVDVGDGTPARDFNNNFGTFPWAAASPFGYNGRYVYTRAEVTFGF
ncbi:MAG TPA: TonB-dependent receptor [Gemmatimonadales bacterium]|nr:TonB-dependent receptor [Gemmatimonadales bacterium]